MGEDKPIDWWNYTIEDVADISKNWNVDDFIIAFGQYRVSPIACDIELPAKDLSAK